MTLEFEGRVALVTGGASGIGRACAWELARAGADLVVADAALWEMSEEQWQLVLDTNLKGAFSYTQAAAGHFRRVRAGRVVNVASIEAGRGRFGLANYAASKAGLIAFTRSAAVELGRYNVNVNAV